VIRSRARRARPDHTYVDNADGPIRKYVIDPQQWKTGRKGLARPTATARPNVNQFARNLFVDERGGDQIEIAQKYPGRFVEGVVEPSRSEQGCHLSRTVTS
jgi:hypothetical protein